MILRITGFLTYVDWAGGSGLGFSGSNWNGVFIVARFQRISELDLVLDWR